MKYSATLEEGEGGEFTASCDQLGVAGPGVSTVAARDAVRAEIRYRVELCPCSSVDDNAIELDVQS